jgi:putative endonuclease
MAQYFCYILTSGKYGTLYTGVTNDLIRRVYEHREGLLSGFTLKYKVHQLVWFEVFENIESAIQREKQIKKWNRAWKIQLIEENNPAWNDLYPSIR